MMNTVEKINVSASVADKTASVTGTVVSFTDELSEENYIDSLIQVFQKQNHQH